MLLSAVFKYMAKQAVDCRNMVRVKVWHTHTTVWLLKNYSQRSLTYYTPILLLDLTYYDGLGGCYKPKWFTFTRPQTVTHPTVLTGPGVE